VTKQSSENEEEIEQLKLQAWNQEQRVQQKIAKFQRLQVRAKGFEPLIAFLRDARTIPMYLEDLNMQILTLRQLKTQEEEEWQKLDQQVTDLCPLNHDLSGKINRLRPMSQGF
jgi:chromosome segregation ATPase